MATYRNGLELALEVGKMKAKITKGVVQSLEPNAKAYEVVDTEIAARHLYPWGSRLCGASRAAA